jgi:hypothetical protein
MRMRSLHCHQFSPAICKLFVTYIHLLQHDRRAHAHGSAATILEHSAAHQLRRIWGKITLMSTYLSCQCDSRKLCALS